MSHHTTLPELARYYRWHAPIYDLTRGSFLFGRKQMIKRVARQLRPDRILEIGCGTGTNLDCLATVFPNASILGIDLSEAMLSRARKKVSQHGHRVQVMLHQYTSPISTGAPFDLILLSYCLTMINPGFERVLDACVDDLAPRGMLAVVDFHNTPHAWFRNWMRVNHVRMDGQVWRALELCALDEVRVETRAAYGGLWTYMSYIGRMHAVPRS